MTCKIPDCGGDAKAHGLCAKHYMRLRRHGDPAKALKRGPKPDSGKRGSIPSITRSLFDDVSASTQNRYGRALFISKKMKELFGKDIWKKAVGAATRPNRSVNFSKLLRIVEIEAAFLVDDDEVTE